MPPKLPYYVFNIVSANFGFRGFVVPLTIFFGFRPSSIIKMIKIHYTFYQILEGWKVESSDNHCDVDTVMGGHDDYSSVTDNETFEQSMKFKYWRNQTWKWDKKNWAWFVYFFLLKNLDTKINDEDSDEIRKWQLGN